MRRLWTWYRARRWWTKVLLASTVLLFSTVALYIVIRFGTYQALSRTTAGEFTPAGAQVVARCVDGAGTWARFQKTEAGRILLGKLLRDTTVRGPINEILKANGAPTLNDLDDRRFHDRTNGVYREETILSLAGRDVMAAARLGDRPEQTRFCVATKIGFWHYCLLPFASLAPGLYGGQKADVGGTSCIKVQGLLVAFDGPIVLVSDDTALLTDALKRKGPKEPPPKAVRVTVAFERSAVLNDYKKFARGFPLGIAGVIADPTPMTKLTVDADVAGSELALDIQAKGLSPSSTASASAAPMKWAPAGGAGLVAINVSGEPFWRWLESSSNTAVTPATSQMERYGLQLMRDAMRQLTTFKFPSEVLPKINGPLTTLLGTASGSEGKTFTVVALAFKSADPAGALEALSAMCLRAIDDSSGTVQWVRSTESGFPMGAIFFREDPFDYTDYKCPCAAIINDTIVFANNVEFLKSVLATAAGETSPLVEDGAFRSAQKRLAVLGLKKVGGDETIANGWMSGPSLREGLEGYFPIWAKTEMDTSENMRRLRNEIMGEYHKSGRTPSEDELTSAVIDRMKARVEEATQSMRNAARILEYLRFAAFEAERAGDDGIVIRAALSLKSR